jgi:hypothetical protein
LEFARASSRRMASSTAKSLTIKSVVVDMTNQASASN